MNESNVEPQRNLIEYAQVVAEQYGIPRDDVTPAPHQGEVNLTVFLGQELVLRIPRKQAFEDRLVKEAAVIRVVRSIGVPTAGLVCYDDSHGLVDAPYMILERLHGSTLGELGYDPDVSTRAHESLGEILAMLHTLRMKDIGPIAGVGEPHTFSPEELLERLSDAGWIGGSQARWLSDWFTYLENRGAADAAVSEPVLLHGDIMPSNVVVDREGRVTAVIDWGCADWGGPARDFVDLPARALPSIVSGYRTATRLRDSGNDVGQEGTALEASALWYQLFWALAKQFREPSTSEQRNWSAPKQARLLEILRFLTESPPTPWSDLLRKRTNDLR